MDPEPQQQEEPSIHAGIRSSIHYFKDTESSHRGSVEDRGKMSIDDSCLYNSQVDRQSLVHLLKFLNDQNQHHSTHPIKELDIVQLEVRRRPDGGSLILQRIFERYDPFLTKIRLSGCFFGDLQTTLQVLSGFHSNKTVTSLQINSIQGMKPSNLVNCVSGILQHMPQLQELGCHPHMCDQLSDVYIRALQLNNTLQRLILSHCQIDDDGVSALADSLTDNTTISSLNIGHNRITANGLDHITRLVSKTQLHELYLCCNQGLFYNKSKTTHFVQTISQVGCLRILDVNGLKMYDAVICVVAENLQGNTTLEHLFINDNYMGDIGFSHIKRLVTSTRLKTIDLYDLHVDAKKTTVQDFTRTLRQSQSNLEDIPYVESLFVKRGCLSE
jgi:Leucine Rich repeat